MAKALLDGRVNEKRANASGQRRGPGHLPDGGVEGEISSVRMCQIHKDIL